MQLEGDQLISLTIAGRNNERTQLIFRTTDNSVDAASASVTVINQNAHGPDGGRTDFNLQRPGSKETTQKNISAIFDSILQGRHAEQANNDTAGLHANFPPSSAGLTHNTQHKTDGDLTAPMGGLGSPTGSLPGLNFDTSAFPDLLKNQLGLPPPPPYPGSSALLSNLAKASRAGITSATSPLLVNLLQTDPNLADIANFMNSKMLPPAEMSPQPKKKTRKPRKPKDKNKQTPSSGEGEIPIQSVPNPVHESYPGALPLVTSGSSSNMPSIPMVTQALPASSQPTVTYSSQGKHTSSALSSVVHSEPSRAGVYAYQKLEERTDQRLPDNTAGKIINPYTGLLEPVDSSDSSPSKSDTSIDGLSPHKNMLKRSPPKDKNIHSSAFSSNISLDVKHSSVPSTLSAEKDLLRQLPVSVSSNQYLNSLSSSLRSEHSHLNNIFPGSRCVQSASSKSLERLNVMLKEHTSSVHPETQNVHSTALSTPVHNSKSSYSVDVGFKPQTVLEGSSVPQKTMNPSLALTSSAQIGSVTSVHQQSICHIPSVSSSHSKSVSHVGEIPDHLLNNSDHNPAKTTGSPLVRSPDSENSSQSSLLHDPGMQNDIGAGLPGCTLEAKAYNHDSGVGSSSERSDDTPSEPGDPDFKSGHLEENLRLAENLSKEIIPKLETGTKTMSEIDLINAVHKNGKPTSISANLQSIVSKQNMDVTVGYAISNSIDAKFCDSKSKVDIDLFTGKDKVLSEHPFLNKVGRKGSHQNNTLMHWSSAEKLVASQLEVNRKSKPSADHQSRHPDLSPLSGRNTNSHGKFS